jgi:RNA polymerase sigma-70 factor (ECF subfamily)
MPSLEGEGKDAAAAANGSSQAFERLYRSHHGRVYSLALRMTGPEWAEDLTQEVFTRAWTKLATFRGESAFGTWLHRLAVNLILSRRQTLRRRQGRQLPDGEILERLPTRGRHPGAALDLEAGIQRLPEGARDVFVLFDVEGYPHGEIAKMMGISEGTSKSQLHRARMMLREFLKG